MSENSVSLEQAIWAAAYRTFPAAPKAVLQAVLDMPYSELALTFINNLKGRTHG